MKPGLFVVLLVAAAVGAGTGGTIVGRRLGAGDPSGPGGEVAPSASVGEATCDDRSAMAANAALVEQIRSYKERVARAEEVAVAVDAKHEAEASRAPEALVPSREAWGRMHAIGRARVRVPCARWDAPASFVVRRPTGGMIVGAGGGRPDLRFRLEASGLAPEEMVAAGAAYERARTRTWASIRAICEADVAFREWEASEEDEEVRSAREKIAHCVFDLLPPAVARTAEAVDTVLRLRALGVAPTEVRGDPERVLFALTESTGILFEEMVHAVGREKALVAVDFGLVCVDETTYFGTASLPARRDGA